MNVKITSKVSYYSAKGFYQLGMDYAHPLDI